MICLLVGLLSITNGGIQEKNRQLICRDSLMLPRRCVDTFGIARPVVRGVQGLKYRMEGLVWVALCRTCTMSLFARVIARGEIWAVLSFVILGVSLHCDG